MQVPQTYPDRRICIMGLGYVGLTLAVVMAEAGFEVIGVEVRKDVVEKLRNGEAHFFETGLEPRLKRLVAEARLRIEPRIPEASGVRVYVMTVGTPLGEDGKARLDMIERVAAEVARYLKDGDLVILRSTVKAGITRRVVLPILESAGVRFDLAYCPERTVEGQALQELRTLPQIVGGLDVGANARAAQLFQFLTPTVVRVDSIETAEMIKLVDNTQRDVFFAFSNEVARLCDGLGINAKEVITAGKLGYRRTNLALPGPVGGPCLSKDTYILAEIGREIGLEAEIALAARRTNERQLVETVHYIRSLTDGFPDFPAAPVISLLGLAFKGRPETDDVRGTTAGPILETLKAAYPEATRRGFDTMVSDDGVRAFGLEPQPTLEAAFDGANLAVIANNHPAFAAMPLEGLAERMARPALIYDFWNNFDARELTLPDGVGYAALGSHGLAALPGSARWRLSASL